ncbi:MAG: hypothetical protein ACXWTU_03475 [Methylotenera sp.]
MKKILFIFLILQITNIYAKTINPAKPKLQMQYLGTFDGGQPGVGIYKMYDPSDDVICYILMPETAARKLIEDKLIYEGNNIGSLSCVKARYR